MKQLILLLMLILAFSPTYAQCSFTLNGGSPPFLICSGDLPAILEGSDPNGTFNGAGALPNANGDWEFNPVASNLPGTFLITYTTPDNCEVMEEIEVSAPDQEAIANWPPPFACNNSEPIELTGNLGENGTFLLDGAIVTSIDVSQLDNGVHTIEYVYFDMNNSCVSTDQTNLTILVPPKMDFEGLKPIYCLSDAPSTLIPTHLDPPSLGIFEGPGITGGNIFDPNKAGIGVHEIRHSYCDLQEICCNDTITMVEVVASLIPEFDSFGGSCFSLADTIRYTGTTLDNATFNWSIDDSQGEILSDNGDQIIVKWNTPGDKAVTLKIDSDICSSEEVTEVFSKEGIEVNTIEDESVSLGDERVLVTTATSNNSVSFNYAWSPPVGLSCIDCQSPIAMPVETTTYVVTVTDETGCSANTEVTINVDNERSVYIPNTFTPNDDGTNDALKVYGKGITQVQMTIFNRWGAKIYHSNDAFMEGWNGTSLSGKKVDPGVYLYVMQISFLDSEEPTIRKGNISILR